jgi:dipeptide/tripeptide permease
LLIPWNGAILGFGDAVFEFAETMAFIGLQIDLVLYLINHLNFATTKAATTVTNFAGTAFLCPLLGGFLADAYLGRFATIIVFAFVELVVRNRIETILVKLSHLNFALVSSSL